MAAKATQLPDFSPQAARRILAKYNNEGLLDSKVFDALLLPDGFASLECEILDYKREIGNSRESLAKRIRDIVSLYNTFGGCYLILGVEEQIRNTVFFPVGLASQVMDVARIKSLIRVYTGRNIDISYRQFEVPFQSAKISLGLLHVPKRDKTRSPATFGKDDPTDDKRPIFGSDSIYFRVQDNSVPAHTNEDHWFLASERIDPALKEASAQALLSGATKLILDENLPDRNFICPEFVGRKDEFLQLWKWLADEFQFAKVLAGDGGKGKSSIAYRFAEEVCRTKAYGFEKIIWLTAKTKQFRGLNDDWDQVPETHFRDYDELLRALCSQVAILSEEVEDATAPLLKKLLKGAFDAIPTLVIIDDVDSLPKDQQKMTLETAMQIGNSRARILLTTRKNFTYSSALCVEVAGLPKEEYAQYVKGLCETLGWRPFRSKDLELFRTASDGSPLFTESLIRYKMQDTELTYQADKYQWLP
ncbi:MAG: NB-ARC domain-containing protein, partial [Giesbergeria sp.]